MSQAEQKIVQYLNEAHSAEQGLTRVLQAQIAMTPGGRHRNGLEAHLEQTKGHARKLRTRSKELEGAGNPLQFGIGLLQSAIGQARSTDEPVYTDIELPRNSATGFICAFFATFMGFALIWHIWWLVGAAALGAYATFVVFAWRDSDEYIIPAETVARIDRANRSARGEALVSTQPAL